MNKRPNWCLILVFVGMVHPIFAQNFRLQLGAFAEKIEPSYFNYSGLKNVEYQIGQSPFHQYFWGQYTTQKAAQKALLELKQNTLLADFNQLKVVALNDNFSLVNNVKEPTTPLPQTTELQLFSRSITFKKAQLSLQKTEVAVLEEIASIMVARPALKLRIYSNTGKPSSPKRAMPSDILEHFLLAQAIPAYRIKIIYPEQPLKSAHKQPIILTLVDLKEEIILDEYNNRLIVRQVIGQPKLEALE